MVPVTGSHTRSTYAELYEPEYMRTFPVCNMTAFTATIPNSKGVPHCPTTAGFDALLTVTATVADVARLPAVSRAMAVKLCEPSQSRMYPRQLSRASWSLRRQDCRHPAGTARPR